MRKKKGKERKRRRRRNGLGVDDRIGKKKEGLLRLLGFDFWNGW